MTIRERVPPYEMLKRAILEGELAPGQVLVETSLASLCNVSRTPIREALTRLEQDGLVERTDRGMAVRQRSPEEILDIYETRIVLEAMAARIAADRRSDHDVRLLQRLADLGPTLDSTDRAAMVELNRQFHGAIWRASRNESLMDLLERIELHVGRYPATTLSYPGRWTEAAGQHIAIVRAIEARDGLAAHDMAMRHFTEARDIRLKVLEDEESAAFLMTRE